MRSTNWVRNSFQRLKPALLGMALVFVSASAQAADYIPSGQPIPENIRWVNSTADGVDTRASAFYRNAAGQTSSHSFPVPIGKASLGKMAGAVLKRGAGWAGVAMLLKDLVNGAGWLIDDLAKQVYSPATGTNAPTGSVMWCAGNACTTTQAGAVAAAKAQYGYGVFYKVDGNFWHVYITPGGGTMVFARQAPTTAANPKFDWATGNPKRNITDTELGEMVKASPQVVNAVLIDPQTGAPLRTAELTAALNNLRRALEAANGSTAAPDLVADTDPGATTTPSQSQWPGFCSWASYVCDFIDWVKAPEPEVQKPEVPWEEPTVGEVTSNWSSGLGGGSCPAPVQMNISVGGYNATPELSYDGICQFVTMLRPVLIGLATLLGAFIIAGMRSTKDA